MSLVFSKFWSVGGWSYSTFWVLLIFKLRHIASLTSLTKLGELEKFAHHVCTHIKELSLKVPVGQVWSGYEFITKPDQPGFSSSIHLEVVMEQIYHMKISVPTQLGFLKFSYINFVPSHLLNELS